MLCSNGFVFLLAGLILKNMLTTIIINFVERKELLIQKYYCISNIGFAKTEEYIFATILLLIYNRLSDGKLVLVIVLANK